jgi:presenilin-like A22 family membrane protease
MKHKPHIVIILLTLFLATQFIGLFVVNQYETIPLPYDLHQNSTQITLIDIIFSFTIAFVLMAILMKYKWKNAIRIWFFITITLAISITLNTFLPPTLPIANIAISLPLIIALILAYLKVFKTNAYVHNATELLIYPGIAAIFVTLLNPTTSIILLILISIYDAWAVWKSGIMQKMAKFQMEEIKIFGGFMLPHASQKVKKQIKLIKQKYKGKQIPKSIKKKKFKINLAILGGGDVVFPIIIAGVFLRAYDITPAIFIITGAFAGLLSIFLTSKKDKAYPAMPYITTGILISLLIWKYIF